MAANDAHKVMP